MGVEIATRLGSSRAASARSWPRDPEIGLARAGKSLDEPPPIVDLEIE